RRAAFSADCAMVDALSRTRRQRESRKRRGFGEARAISLAAGRAEGVVVCAGAADAVSGVAQTGRKGLGRVVAIETRGRGWRVVFGHATVGGSSTDFRSPSSA